LRAIFLTGERVYLRGMLEDDKSSAIAWYDTIFPVNSAFAEEQLKEQHQEMWDVSKRQFAIVRSEDDAVIGGAAIVYGGDRLAEIQLHMAPLLANGDSMQAEALRLLVPWLLEEHNMRRVDIELAADQEATITAAQELGMSEGVRLREFFHKRGGRVDALIFQVLNPNEEHKHA
jgi:RimJ/RimL family protein N-acetyltransferase